MNQAQGLAGLETLPQLARRKVVPEEMGITTHITVAVVVEHLLLAGMARHRQIQVVQVVLAQPRQFLAHL